MAPVYIGDKRVNKIFVGDREIGKGYCGDLLFFQKGFSCNDPDAIAFLERLDSNNVTSEIEQAACYWFTQTKIEGYYNKIKVYYPYFGITANDHKWNAVNPDDSNDSFRIEWQGTRTHNSDGAKSDGSTGYGKTFFNPVSHLSTTNIGIHTWIRLNPNVQNNCALIGNITAPGANSNLFQLIVNAPGSSRRIFSAGQFGTGSVNKTELTHLRIGNEIHSWTYGVHRGSTNDPPGTPLNLPLYVLAANLAGSPANFSEQTICQHIISEGLSQAEAQSLYFINYQVQSILNRIA